MIFLILNTSEYDSLTPVQCERNNEYSNCTGTYCFYCMDRHPDIHRYCIHNIVAGWVRVAIQRRYPEYKIGCCSDYQCTLMGDDNRDDMMIEDNGELVDGELAEPGALTEETLINAVRAVLTTYKAIQQGTAPDVFR